ncbi:hypothetical protein PM10SUCC1_07700 [Propionigenium maris DSM 9537]|uniref:HTH marR-type domain-containing protein n=1 Tax=Propionigenium maris DSM 9537 TaxID=1123000 RepID=A0A9W6GJE7_9FUSO|nr:hypothetical protein [Propionigenium maris]GLI55255.1 hypothetical protein PM10SUCC1_07700 [Propionigenium maris DSM 9537]
MRYKSELKRLDEYYEMQDYFKTIKKVTRLSIVDIYILIYIKNQIDNFSDLNSSIKVDRSLISRRISEMERSGLVRKCRIDRRNRIFITEDGSQALKESIDLYKKHLENAIS